MENVDFHKNGDIKLFRISGLEREHEKNLRSNENETPMSSGIYVISSEASFEAEKTIKIEAQPRADSLLYKLDETPPAHYLLLFAIQQCCLAISTPLGTAVIVAEAVCAQDEQDIKVRILSSTMLMMGLSTFAMTTFGVRLPIFQGPSATYIIPLLAMMSLPEFSCPATFIQVDSRDNSSVLMAVVNNVTVMNQEIVFARLNAYGGSLLLAGFLHFLFGMTGLVSIITRFVGPITIVPVVTLFGIYIHTVVVSFSETNWLVAAITASTCLIFALYLSNYNTPVPFWTPGRGFHIIWQPFHQTFALLISIIIGWLISYAMTETDFLSSDPKSVSFNARTDARAGVIDEVPWFLFPYPGQFGVPSFSIGAFITFLINTVLSVLDSIADYNACAKVSKAPPPPAYSINRGIAVEGLMSMLSGSMGCGHATVSYGENIGIIGISRVASRSVFQLVGFMYIVFAVFGKVGAFFITMPYSVVGGSQIISFGILIGVILSYLRLIDLNSTRNLSIIGIALLLGMMLPYWVQKNPNAIHTGIGQLDNVILLCLSNPSFVGGFFACFMDNTVPGTKEERGVALELIAATEPHVYEENILTTGAPSADISRHFEHDMSVYRLPWIDETFRKWKIAKFIPIFESKKSDV
ncbi:solute carrier family 23 member 1 [Biomphalaria glabrata]|nr:solute carrier family 23 member 1 [Biomphalaria glabrata]